MAEENLISYAQRLEQEVSGSYIKERLTEEKVVSSPSTGTQGKPNGHDVSVFFEDDVVNDGNGLSSADVDLVGSPTTLVSSALSIDGIRERVIQVLMNSQPVL